MKKKQLRRALFFVLTNLVITLGASAQTVDYGTPYGLFETISSYYGVDGAIKYEDYDTFGQKLRMKLDTLNIGMLDGHHWGGNSVTAGEDMEKVYLVNKATGEYLVLGENWGTTPMQDYTGTMFNLRGNKYCRADDLGKDGGKLAGYQVDGNDPVLGSKAARQGKGYLICLAHNEERVIGRQQTASAGKGTFEYRPYMVARSRDRKEYVLHINDGCYKDTPPNNNDDGQFIFYFHPVKKADGKQYYVIYTHRQTTRAAHDSFYDGISSPNDYYKWETLPEYGNRDTYLCLKSTPSPTGDFHMVTYKKFAGKMYNFAASQTQFFYSDDQYYYENFSMSNNNTFEGRTPTWEGAQTISGMFAYPTGEDEQAYLDKKVINEEDLSENGVTLQKGLESVYDQDSCLWKIVTYDERKNYRVTANIDNPVDMSFLIENHKFYPNYSPYTTGGPLGDVVNMGWEWHDAETGVAAHTHPYNTSGTETEFHKIGTHYYDRWGWGEAAGTGTGVKANERQMTQGEEANYVGSIYNGTAALRQEIKGLRPGRYIVYCRAFYSPFGMAHFDNKDISDFYSVTDADTPSYDGADVSSDNKAIIEDKALSDKSFFFAIGKDGVERKRDVPNIFSGMMPIDESHLDKMSKHDLIKYFYPDPEVPEGEGYYPYVQDFLYTPLGYELFKDATIDYDTIAGSGTPDDEYVYGNFRFVDANWNAGQAGKTLRDCYNLLRDSTVFAMVKYDGVNYFVPRNLTGAARFFKATDRTKHENAMNYRIGLPVEVGDDGILTIGIKHEKTSGKEEWVCFDNFELVYYGDANHWEFVIDESDPINNTRYHDMFDWEGNVLDRENKHTSTYVIKRGLDPEKYVPIVLPVGLTKKQVRQAFGDDVKISTPSHLTYKTIHFAAVATTGGSETDTCMYAGQPYIVKPSIPAPISSQQTWTRTRFVGENPFDWQVTGATTGGWDNDYAAGTKYVYVAKPGRNNSLLSSHVETREFMPGPIYFVDSVVIDKEKHYLQHKEDQSVSKVWYDTDYYMASSQWKPLQTFVPTQQRRVTIKGSTDRKEYELQAFSYYDAPGSEVGSIPPYSYFMSGGNLKFNGATGSKQTKGFSFYLQIWEYEPTNVEIVKYGTTANSAPNGSESDKSGTWGKKFTSNAASGCAGVEVATSSWYGINRDATNSMRCFVLKPSAAGASDAITITAPDGYLIDGYEIGGWYKNSSETYTLTAADGTTSININTGSGEPTSYLKTSGLGTKSTTITMSNSNSTNSSYAAFPHFTVKLIAESSSSSSSAPAGAKVFAGNVGDFEWVPVTPLYEGDFNLDNETSGVNETYREYENPASDLYYDLQGRAVGSYPSKPGIYIYRGKKIAVK